ncbi:MAG: DUF523 domain-containing protein [Desulfobulbaceae bacterium]|nr:DUF523 domain-containing protein [Desulfobulbaceae bacterium]
MPRNSTQPPAPPWQNSHPIILVSACLIGLATRYDGERLADDTCLKELKKMGAIVIPVCPEQLGGLATPRGAANIIGGDGEDVLAGRARVISDKGEDVTDAFLLGAEQVLTLIRRQPVSAIFLKSRSPSCGITPRLGVTAALLARHGYELREF